MRWVLLVAGLVLVSACGKQAPPATQSGWGVRNPSALTTSAVIEQGNNAYCNTLWQWLGYDHFKVGGEGEPGSPGFPLAGKPGAAAANKAYRMKYLRFAVQALRLAPTPALKAAWKKYYAVVSGPLVKLDEKFHYIFTSDKYQNLMNNPPPEFMKGFMAFSVIDAYEGPVCGNGFVEPSTKKYAGSASSTYCRNEKQGGEAFGEMISAGTKPSAMKAFVTSKKFESMTSLAQKAPAPIRKDVVAYTKWTLGKWVPLLMRYDFDLPKLVETGTSVERHALNSRTPDIAGAFSRIEAYQGEVCHL